MGVVDKNNCDFSGFASKNNLLCGDGRTIRNGAFDHLDGVEVPLVWNHGHKDPTNVLGTALLEKRPEGMYTYAKFNNTGKAQHIKEAVRHGDLNRLSIYANHLIQKGDPNGLRDVYHGDIQEVSLCLSGANPGAKIDTVLAHNGEVYDGYAYEFDEENRGIIECDEPIVLYHSNEPEEVEENPEVEEEGMADTDTLQHSEEPKQETQEKSSVNEKTVGEIFDAMSEEQKNVVYYMIGTAVEEAKNGGSTKDEEDNMKHNAWAPEEEHLEHSIEIDFAQLNSDAKRLGSLKEAVLQHAESFGVSEDELMHTATYGIDQIDTLFPEYKSLNTPPEFISRNMDWVQGVLNGVHHTPFSRIKSMFADITEDDARARGYMKGNLKKEEVFTLLKRVTDPQTIYKKQKLDRDDVIDITDFDVIAWIKAEMRMMLDEEIARAILVGDGRLASSDDKIQQVHVRSIYLDDDFYAIKVPVRVSANATDEEKAKALINAAIKARKDYKGSGNLTFYTTADVLTDGLLLEDGIGHKLYKSEAELATAMRMSKIVEVEVMEGLTREGSDHKTRPLLGIAVNLKDYNVGADKGGAVNMFDDFDIDYNQMKYLIETRISGALIKPKSALVFELDQAAAAGGNGGN